MDKRKAYEEKLAAQLEEWNAQVALFRAKADKASAAAKIEYFELTEELRRKHDDARTKLHELKSSTDDAWEELKTGAEKAWSTVQKSFHDAATKFK